jgi:YfiH family protein
MEQRFHFWNIRESQGLLYLDFTGWPGVRVLYSTRIGGLSPPPFESLNLHFGRGDAEHRVRENRRRFFLATGIDEHCVTLTRQVHSSRINVIRGAGEAPHGDGMITDQEGFFLGIFTADCLGIFLFAPPANAIGAIHAGRKGLAASVVENGVRALCETYQVDPGCIQALCGPSIGPCCYEIGEELRSGFKDNYITERMHRIYLDLWGIAADQLADAGVRKVYLPHICTACNPDLFFSYRVSGGMVGENLGLIGLIPR